MKKQVAILLTAALLPAILTGCGKPTPEKTAVSTPDDVRSQEQIVPEITDNNNGAVERDGIEITIDKFFPTARIQTTYPGVRRRFEFDRTGVYTVEYIHTPYGAESDDTLNYRLELSDDNTYSMVVTANGVTSDHSGKWYGKRDAIMLFYDEPIEPPAHNTYVADSMYCEIISQGKLLIYDRCYTVVLSKSPQHPIELLSHGAKQQGQ